MSHRFVVLTTLALANLSVFAVAEAASSVEQADSGVLVAVLDTGVSLPAASAMLPGVDMVEPGTSAEDENGHGTAVATTIAAACGGCTILPIRVLSRSGTAPWSRVAAGIVWAVDSGARVVNVSIAGPNGSPALRNAVAYATARDVVVVASAGNNGNSRRQYPAAYPGVVAVAATDASGRLADWSSRGGWVDLAASGCDELPQPGRSRAWACGTSFAAPHVSAAAAAALSEDPAATAAGIAASLPGRVGASRPSAALQVSGRPRTGSVLRASLTRKLGAGVRWYRCGATRSPFDCVAVSAGSTYRVRPRDAGRTIVARVATTPFGGLWLASSPRLKVSV